MEKKEDDEITDEIMGHYFNPNGFFSQLEKSCLKMVGFDMTTNATKRLFEKTPYKPADVDVIELHDCFSANELITYEALGLCPLGKVY